MDPGFTSPHEESLKEMEQTTKTWSRPETPMKGSSSKDAEAADHDLSVMIRILTKLKKYYPSFRNGLSSRGWGTTHDGFSYRIEKVSKLEMGSVLKQGRKRGCFEWFRMARIVAQEMNCE